MTKTVLILGATSDVGMSCADVFAKNGFAIQLAARNPERLKPAQADLRIRHGVEVSCYDFDANKYEQHHSFYNGLETKPDVVICMFGVLGDQEKGEKEWKEAETIIAANYTGAVSVLNVVAQDFVKRGSGMIIGVSSVAGERGRMSNYLYGSAKAGFTAYLSGLRNKLNPTGVHVMTVKPGFMDTKMTEGLPLPKPLTASPEQASKAIFNAYRKKKNVVYIKGIWKLIMFIIRTIPEFIFKKLKL
jgi:decaprenylphospho-beta-D-erythro-pentofuranosid-2-ulose 2-reductase